jgi:hypothetical protein
MYYACLWIFSEGAGIPITPKTTEFCPVAGVWVSAYPLSGNEVRADRL